MLEIAVLGLLNESPLHGYELRKRLASLLGAFRAFSYGSLYPTLRRLSEAGWISEAAPLAGDAPARSRRGKRVYQLTADGKEHLAELLAEVGPDAFDDEGFGARLAFFAQTRSDIRLQILEGRRRRVEEQREGMRRSALGRTGERVDRYTRELHQHGLESVDREVRWLTELIETERTETGRTETGRADTGRGAPPLPGRDAPA
ncbi:PadR family transcriptional regulator [uncultured Jatrophihabitans sp.]|uniref:PadR family transcriptional regulator n=1 Tax=uncultured Jatrophihabitans sp. TaxID=1610747 RepID=UPI0035CC9A4F